MKLSFVFPMFNEIGNIERVIRSTHAVARRTLEDFEIIVVDDASTDGCGEVAERMRVEFPELRVLRHERNRTIGGALKTGFAAARLDYVLYMDSDLPVAFTDVEGVLRDRNSIGDMLIGYRVGPAESVYRQIQSRLYNALLRSLFGLRVRDANFAFKLFRRELVEESPRSEGSFIDAELLLEATARRWRINEIPLQYHTRQAGKSTIGGPRVVPKLLREMAAYRRTRWKGSRRVVFNADDFGLSANTNEGVIAAHENGVIKSVSIVASGPAFEQAAEYARAHVALDVGVHFALCDGRPVSDPAKVRSLVDANGAFPRNHAAFVRRWLGGGIRLDEVAAELRAQIEKTRRSGLRISHLDSHQHLHALPGILPLVVDLAIESKIPVVRNPDERGGRAFTRPFRTAQRFALSSAWRVARRKTNGSPIATTNHFLGMIDAGRWNGGTLRHKVRALRPGLTEICCHPRGASSPNESPKAWTENSDAELAALCDPALPKLLEEERVRLTTFREAFATG